MSPILALTTTGWPDYELIDSGNKQRLERFGKYIVIRPDPQAIWKPRLNQSVWNRYNARYVKRGTDGTWEQKPGMPHEWPIKYNNLQFTCKLTPFKHTGVFPEQSIHWDWMTGLLNKNNQQANVLNLFGYTGVASLVAAAAGARVTHVDASYQAIGWARENQKMSKLEDKPIRWILDDVIKFTRREIKRGTKYDGIIMDPPIYGHGPNGEKWSFEYMFPELMNICTSLFTPKPLFLIVNAYAISASSAMLQNVLGDYMTKFGGSVEAGELIIQESNNGRPFSTGIFARWSGGK